MPNTTPPNALTWKLDPIAATEIEHRLASASFDQQALNMEVYVQVREIFIMFESLLNAVQGSRLLVLREIDRMRLAGLDKGRAPKRPISARQNCPQR